MTTAPHVPAPRPALSARERIAWRRAADELLIAAIFGAGHEPLRASELASPQAAAPTSRPDAITP